MTTELKDKAAEAGLVVKQQGGAMAATRSASVGVEGLDNVSGNDLRTGSIIVIQDGIKELVRKGYKAGKLFNTQTEKEFDTAEIIPVFHQKRWFQFDNSQATPKLIGSSVDEFDPMFKGRPYWGKLTDEQKRNRVKADVYPGYACSAILNGEPVRIRFVKAASYYAGDDIKELAVRFARSEGLPLWGKKYKLFTKLMPPAHGNPDYWALKVEVVGNTTDEERNFASQLYASFKVKPVVDDTEVPF